MLMALQTGMSWLEFGRIKGKEIKTYFAAVRAGFDGNCEPMQQIFTDLICLALKVARQEKTSEQCIIRLSGNLDKSSNFALTSA
jgi:hypothetical protein